MTAALTFALIGHPVAHSISPELHHAAYRALGAPHVYEKRDCPDEPAVRREVDALRRGNIAGINVTVPWKRLALALADRQHELAAQIGAANVLVREADGAIVAYNTDALALAAELGGRAPPRSVAIIGSGGAARAAVAASCSLGADRIAVIGRRWTAGVLEDTWANAADFSALGAIVMAWPKPGVPSDWTAHVAGSEVVVQATSAGMQGADSGEVVTEIVPWSRLAPGVLAYDVVYNPPVTPFLARRTRRTACEARGGLGMLVGQAALSIELWLGVQAPRDAMARCRPGALLRRARHESSSGASRRVERGARRAVAAGAPRRRFRSVSMREWLHTNGAGAYSMSTLALMHTRRQHGMLVAALDPPLGRHVILVARRNSASKFEGRLYRLRARTSSRTSPRRPAIGCFRVSRRIRFRAGSTGSAGTTSCAP